jgi:hypothetical protein
VVRMLHMTPMRSFFYDCISQTRRPVRSSLKFRPYVAVSNEMKQIIMAEADGVRILNNIQFLPLLILNYL